VFNTFLIREAGAFDFIPKPETESVGESAAILKRQLTIKIRTLGTKRFLRTAVSPKKTSAHVSAPPSITKLKEAKLGLPKAILIGVSTGGPKALVSLLPSLCEITDLPIFIVQHMPATFTESLANSLDRLCSATVIEAEDQCLIKKQYVYIAPGGKHMLLRRDSKQQLMTILNRQPLERGCRPSVDVLFRSAAAVFGGNVIALILTGMGDDGVKGIATLKRGRAYVIAQDEDSSVVWGMPGSAVESGNVDLVLPLSGIPGEIATLI